MNKEGKISTKVEMLPCMQRSEFLAVRWKKGNKAMLTNGKAYKIIRFDKKREKLWLHSEEYNVNFGADCHITHKPLL